VLEESYDRVMERLLAAAASLRVGNPEEPGITVGPVIDEKAYKRILGMIEVGKKEATLAYQAKDLPNEGYFIPPTIFTDVKPTARIAREEIFGPVVCALPFKDLADAIQKGNDTPFGLAAGVWTRDLRKAHQAAAALEAGTVWVNCYNAFDNASPWGGFKQSGWGREKGPYGLDLFTQIKSVVVNYT
jgi:acyl-CoA reductase-like NAD-dependent aldehyde dehydrogenase